MGENRPGNMCDIGKCLEDLKARRKGFESRLLTQEQERDNVDREMQRLTEKRVAVDQTILETKALIQRIDESIKQSEDAYLKLIESSQTLAAFVRKEVDELKTTHR